MGRQVQAAYFEVWPTAWGPMGAAASAVLQRVVLPQYQMKDLVDLLSWEHPGAVRRAEAFEDLIRLTGEYFRGKRVDFSELECEFPPADTLTGQVLRACRTIPYGQTRSYGQIARMIGRPQSGRAVAAALGRNRIPLVIPCHRVIYSDGRIGGFSAPGGVALKQRLLALEGSP